MKLNVKDLLQNKIVLYVILFISVSSMFSYLMAQNYAAVLFFLLIAFLTNYFSKNMIIVLGIAVLSTNMLASVTNVFSQGRLREGLDKDDEDDEDDEDNDDDNSDNNDDNKGNLNTDINKAEKIDAKLEHATKQLHQDIKKLEKKSNCGDLSKSSCQDNSDCKWAGGICKQTSKSSFQNLNPASYPNSNKSKPNLDQAGTIEAAYDNLENIMGTDSIRAMTADTQKLADRQKDLIDQLKNVAPLISQTTKMISSFNMDGKLQGMIDGLTKNISSLNSSAPEGAIDPSPN